MKRILTALTILALALVMAISAFATNVNVIQPGDANADGEIDIKDIVLLAQYLAGWDVQLGGDYDDGLKEKITITWENGKEYLNFEAYKEGFIQYYYLKSPSVSKSGFVDGFNSATKKGSFTVIANKAMKMEILGDAVSSSDFKYVAAALVDDTGVLSVPVVFEREALKPSFYGSPTVSQDKGSDLLKGTAATTGDIYYYYTTNSIKPATYAAAETAYKSAMEGYFGKITINSTSVSNNLTVDSTDSTYKYVVVFLKGDDDVKYAPVIIPRATVSSSISSASIKESNGKDLLSGTAVTAAGQLYYYYTSTSTKPDKYSDAETAYAAVTNSSYKGEIALSSTSVSKDLGIESTDGTYKYVVVFLKGNDGTKYEPVILTKTVKTVEAPKLPPYILTTSEDGYDYLVITHTSTATVKVLYNSSAMNYDGSAFDSEFNANNKDVTGVLRLGYSGTASANKETKIKLGKSADITAAGYTKALIRIGNADPQKVDRIDDADGFDDDIAPSVLKTSDGKDIIAFTPYSGAKYGDKVMYMYVSSSKGYTSEAFLEAYEDVADHLKGTVAAGDALYTPVSLPSDAKKSKEITEGYVAFMFIGSGRNYQPVTVARTSIGTCISGTPSVTYDVDKSSAFISLNAKLPFTLQYFVIEENIYNKDILAVMFNTKKMPDNSEIKVGELGSGASTTTKVVAGKNDKLNLNEEKIIVNETSKYLAIRAVTDGGATKYDPIVVPVNVNDDGINSLSDDPVINFSSNNGKIMVTISANSNAVGKTFCFWYTNTEPKTEAQYNAIFKETKNSGSLTVTKTGVNDFEAGKWIDLADYKYFVYKVVDSTGKSMTPGYKEITAKYRQNADIFLDSDTLAMLHVRPCDTATYDIYWFYSTTQIDVTRSNFMTKYGAVAAGYKNVKKDAKVSNANRDVVDVITNFAQPTGANDKKYEYVYVCLYDTTLKKYYQPAELKLTANS